MLAIFEVLFFLIDGLFNLPLYAISGVAALIALPMWSAESIVINIFGWIILTAGIGVGLFVQFKWFDVLFKSGDSKNN